MSPRLWAWWLAFEAQCLAGDPEAMFLRPQAEAQIMRTYEAHLNTLPLRYSPTWIRIDSETVDPDWRDNTVLWQQELRVWAREHCPELLDSQLVTGDSNVDTPPSSTKRKRFDHDPELQQEANELALAFKKKFKRLPYQDEVLDQLKKNHPTLRKGTIKRRIRARRKHGGWL